MFEKCDSNCSARATITVMNENQYELKFCNHHYRKNESALLEAGWDIFDGELV